MDPDSPDVVSCAAGLADMLIAVEGTEADSHWTDTARYLSGALGQQTIRYVTQNVS